jgi:NAD(P)H-hydrate repair Nnr-like enzyme with NAD(P)H-hydrate epimerase domain
MKLVTVPQMRAIEKDADANGVSYAELMENAGRGLAELVHALGQQKKVEFIVARVLLADDVLGILNLATYINSCR